jgi:hypothetical protein
MNRFVAGWKQWRLGLSLHPNITCMHSMSWLMHAVLSSTICTPSTSHCLQPQVLQLSKNHKVVQAAHYTESFLACLYSLLQTNASTLQCKPSR